MNTFRYDYFFLQGEGPADHSGEGEGGGEGETGGERGGQSGGGTTAANPAVISLLLSLKGQCHEMNNFFKALKIEIKSVPYILYWRRWFLYFLVQFGPVNFTRLLASSSIR
jgi:hypothetical protein